MKVQQLDQEQNGELERAVAGGGKELGLREEDVVKGVDCQRIK